MIFKKQRILFLFLMVSVIGFSQENTITEIRIEGLKKTKESYLKKLIKFNVGSSIDSVAIKKDVKTLVRLPAIANASFKLENNDNNNFTLTYIVKENRTVIPNVNVWTGLEKQLSYKIGLNEFNFLGRGIALGGFYQKNEYDSFGFGFTAPYLFSSKFGLSLNYKNWKSNEPLYFGENVANYTYGNKSVDILGIYEADFKNKFKLGVNFFNENYQYKSGDVNEGTPLNLNLDKILFKALYEYNALEYDNQYIEGFKNEVTVQYVKATDTSQEDFLIAWNDFFYFNKVNSKGIWANRLRFGLANNSDSPFAPFALDNNVNIRGVGILIDRGTGVLLLNSEYRHTLFEKKWFVLQGNAFVDAGTWRNPGGALNDFVTAENVRIYPGLGLRFMHKYIYNAVFRIDFGYGIANEPNKGVVFGIGQYF